VSAEYSKMALRDLVRDLEAFQNILRKARTDWNTLGVDAVAMGALEASEAGLARLVADARSTAGKRAPRQLDAPERFFSDGGGFRCPAVAPRKRRGT
jgi:hypothetical protein